MLRLPIENTLDREEKIMAEWISKALGELTSLFLKGYPQNMLMKKMRIRYGFSTKNAIGILKFPIMSQEYIMQQSKKYPKINCFIVVMF